MTKPSGTNTHGHLARQTNTRADRSSDWVKTPKQGGLWAPDWLLSRRQQGENLLVASCAVAVGGGCGVPAHTDISYVVPPTPVTFLTLLWRLGLRVAPWALGWQSICPLTFTASLSGKRRTQKIINNTNQTWWVVAACRLVVWNMTALNDKDRIAIRMVTWKCTC